MNKYQKETVKFTKKMVSVSNYPLCSFRIARRYARLIMFHCNCYSKRIANKRTEQIQTWYLQVLQRAKRNNIYYKQEER